MWEIYFLEVQIDFHKRRMVRLAEEFGISSMEVLRESELVDELIVSFMRQQNQLNLSEYVGCFQPDNCSSVC